MFCITLIFLSNIMVEFLVTDYIVLPFQGSSDVTAVVSDNDHLEPYILVVESNEVYLVVDKRVVHQVEVMDIPFNLMAAYFVYNICYPKGCSNFYTFLEIMMLNYPSRKASPTVKYFLSKMEDHD